MYKQIEVQRGFEEVKEIYELATEHKAIIAGGYARYMCSTHPAVIPAGDVDLFPLNGCDTILLRSRLSTIGFKSVRDGRAAYSLENASGTRVQVIKPVEIGKVKTYGTIEEILSFFDFSIVSVGITSPTTALADTDFECHEFCRELRLRTVNSPVAAIMRANKYAAKGYWFPPTEAMRLFALWDTYSPEYRKTFIEFMENREGWTQEEIDEGEEMLWFGEPTETPAVPDPVVIPPFDDDIPF